MDSMASAVIWRRLVYMLTPQIDLYENVPRMVQGRRVLEVGFGTGIGCLQYAHAAEYIDAVEIDPAAVAFARRMLPLRNVRWLLDDVVNPTRTYRAYDVFLAIEVLEHVVDRGAALRTLRGALAPGGWGLVTVPNSLRYRRRTEALNAEEWTPDGALAMLGEVFQSAILLDARLMPQADQQHRESPIVVAVQRGRA